MQYGLLALVSVSHFAGVYYNSFSGGEEHLSYMVMMVGFIVASSERG